MARAKSGPELVTQELTQWESPSRREPAPARVTSRKSAQVIRPRSSFWTQVRFWLGWAAAVVVLLSILLGLLAFEQFIRHDARFKLVSPVEIGEDSPSLKIEGVNYVSQRDISKLFERDFGRSLYSVPIEQRRLELRSMNWVKEATVTRLWPNVVKVNVEERRPVAFVALVGPDSLTTTSLIDPEGVLLPMPEQAVFSLPVITGIKRQDRPELRTEKVQRIATMLKEAASMNEKISEVNIAELNNLKTTVQIDKRAVVLYLGNKRYAQRIDKFLKNYDQIRKSRPDATTFDVRNENRFVAVVE